MLVINLRAKNIELTSTIRTYVEDKFNTLAKFRPDILQIDIDISKNTRHHHKGEIFECVANLEIPGHNLIRVEKTEESLYKAIDKVKDHLREILAQLTEKDRDARYQPKY